MGRRHCTAIQQEERYWEGHSCLRTWLTIGWHRASGTAGRAGRRGRDVGEGRSGTGLVGAQICSHRSECGVSRVCVGCVPRIARGPRGV